MKSAILTLLWRNVLSVNELTRILNRGGFLWVNPTKVSQKALYQLFIVNCLPKISGLTLLRKEMIITVKTPSIIA